MSEDSAVGHDKDARVGCVEIGPANAAVLHLEHDFAFSSLRFVDGFDAQRLS